MHYVGFNVEKLSHSYPYNLNGAFARCLCGGDEKKGTILHRDAFTGVQSGLQF